MDIWCGSLEYYAPLLASNGQSKERIEFATVPGIWSGRWEVGGIDLTLGRDWPNKYNWTVLYVKVHEYFHESIFQMILLKIRVFFLKII